MVSREVRTDLDDPHFSLEEGVERAGLLDRQDGRGGVV